MPRAARRCCLARDAAARSRGALYVLTTPLRSTPSRLITSSRTTTRRRAAARASSSCASPRPPSTRSTSRPGAASCRAQSSACRGCVRAPCAHRRRSPPRSLGALCLCLCLLCSTTGMSPPVASFAPVSRHSVPSPPLTTNRSSAPTSPASSRRPTPAAPSKRATACLRAPASTSSRARERSCAIAPSARRCRWPAPSSQRAFAGRRPPRRCQIQVIKPPKTVTHTTKLIHPPIHTHTQVRHLRRARRRARGVLRNRAPPAAARRRRRGAARRGDRVAGARAAHAAGAQGRARPRRRGRRRQLRHPDRQGAGRGARSGDVRPSEC